jgi:hypothetical protein
MMLSVVFARNGNDPLNHYGLISLNDAGVSADLAGRFMATGTPVFMVHDLRIGVAQGDLIRFKDKVIYIDAAVWQTLETTGALTHLSKTPAVHLQARSKSADWKSRSDLVSNSREKKAYLLGGEMLKILEDYFGGIPGSQEMVLRFENGVMNLMAPYALLDALQFTNVRKVPKGGKPLIVSDPPNPKVFLGKEYSWTLWGADPSEPESGLRYALEGDSIPGLIWNPKEHRLEGIPTKAGTFNLVARVKNPNNAEDTLAFSLNVGQNIPPEISGEPKSRAVMGSVWSFEPYFSDPDHRGDELTVWMDSLPPGMMFNPLTSQLEWNVSDSLSRDAYRFKIFAADPAGDTTSREFSIRVLSPMLALQSMGIRFSLPWDTLVQRHEYTWQDESWLGADVQLLKIEGDDSTHYEKDPLFGTGFLRIVPQQVGIYNIRFTFLIDNSEVEMNKTFVVKPNRPPIFKSTLNTERFNEGQKVWYKPVAADPEADSVTISVVNTEGRIIRWNGEALKIWTDSPGVFSLEFVASDPYGGVSRQRISYRVETIHADWNGFSVRNQRIEDLSYWWGFYQRGIARIGVFTPKLNEVMAAAPAEEKDWFYGTVGASILGTKALARGNYFWCEGGLTFRRPTNKITTGGLMLHMDGRWKSSDRKYPWMFEMEVLAHMNQAMIVVDTSGMGAKQFRVEIEPGQAQVDIDDIDIDSLVGEYLGPAYEQVLKDMKDDNNFVYSFRFDNLFPLGAGLYTGPSYWLLHKVIPGGIEQHLGFSFRHQYEYRFLSYVQNLRMGWGGSNSPFSMYYDITLNFGYWD